MNSPKVQKAIDEAFAELLSMSTEELDKELNTRVQNFLVFMNEDPFNPYFDIYSREFLRQT